MIKRRYIISVTEHNEDKITILTDSGTKPMPKKNYIRDMIIEIKQDKLRRKLKEQMEKDEEDTERFHFK